MYKLFLSIASIALLCFSSTQNNQQKSGGGLQATLDQAKEGDTVFLAEGTFKDLAIEFSDQGEKGKPVVLMIENSSSTIKMKDIILLENSIT